MKIISVEKKSVGAELGLQPGDKVEAIDGSRVKDIIDYRFKVSDDQIRLKVRQNGELVEYDLEKDLDDDLGLEFEDMRIRKCANDCVFCFVDQNPEGMRSGMYFRDGDFRMSFLHGHYITLTNMGWKELKRVVEQRLSPLYISVHVTDPDKRLEMFLYGKDDNLLSKFEYLTENGIELHSQVVLCPTWNDGPHLEKTIADIHQFAPMAKSISIIPVGLTKHREKLPYLPPVTNEYAEKLLQDYITHRLDRERQILEAISKGNCKIPDMVKIIYKDVDPQLHPAAAMSTLAHLNRMINNNEVLVEGKNLDANYNLV